ncbi:hypothetical protein NT2_25_00110 [Caenibius tardaugens NBRC 16725]|uniref:HTH cro/C1-type domain-containing protein n=1 Tax=Caenibius tardaugens NBRC 16725 TaxID=1219035 RepID=U2YQD3_9SPHN|nr:helix-turn-helix transcriptional regulator [Caenibius tardaugens]GAD51175.1 hypothetical protein NT2_25_00110 [Caenibius tardaugens NBRC 16725]
MVRGAFQEKSYDLAAALRNIFRSKGLKNADVAELLGVSEVTVKRWLYGRGLTLNRLMELCHLADVTLGEIAEKGEGESCDLNRALTLNQERELSRNTLLSFLFFMIMNGWPPRDLHNDFDIPMEVIEGQLVKLERLALIDRLPGERVRSRIDRRVAWTREPMRRHFEQHMKWQFMDMDFGSVDSIYTYETIKLSAEGLAKIEKLLHKFRMDVQDLSDFDRKNSLLPKNWHGVLLAVRPLDMDKFKRLGF